MAVTPDAILRLLDELEANRKSRRTANRIRQSPDKCQGGNRADPFGKADM
jgi:hypothetical protein